MQVSTALNHRSRAKSALARIFTEAKAFGHRHSYMLERRAEVLQSIAHCPGWVREYLDGYWDCMQENAWRNDLVFGGYHNGTFYSTHRSRNDYYEKLGFDACVIATNDGEASRQGHYWIVNGKPRPFSV